MPFVQEWEEKKIMKGETEQIPPGWVDSSILQEECQNGLVSLRNMAEVRARFTEEANVAHQEYQATLRRLKAEMVEKIQSMRDPYGDLFNGGYDEYEDEEHQFVESAQPGEERKLRLRSVRAQARARGVLRIHCHLPAYGPLPSENYVKSVLGNEQGETRLEAYKKDYQTFYEFELKNAQTSAKARSHPEPESLPEPPRLIPTSQEKELSKDRTDETLAQTLNDKSPKSQRVAVFATSTRKYS